MKLTATQKTQKPKFVEPTVGKLYRLIKPLRSGQFSDNIPPESISLLLNLYEVGHVRVFDRIYEVLYDEKKRWVFLTSKEGFFDYFEELTR